MIEYSWQSLSSTVVITEKQLLGERWLAQRQEVFDACFPGWPSIYWSMSPLPGLLVQKIQQATESLTRLIDEAIFEDGDGLFCEEDE
jgi:hypothetical protein